MARRFAVHEMIVSRKSPKSLGPYSHAIRVKQPGAMLFVSGQLPMELPTGHVFTGDIKRQAELALMHLKNIVLDAGFSMDEVVKCTIYLVDIKHFDVVNMVYQKMFISRTLPARVVVQVAGLPGNAGIEIDAMAVQKAAELQDIPPPQDYEEEMYE